MERTPPPDGVEVVPGRCSIQAPGAEGASRSEVRIIGFDRAKYSFRMHGVMADGSIALRRKVHRDAWVAS